VTGARFSALVDYLSEAQNLEDRDGMEEVVRSLIVKRALFQLIRASLNMLKLLWTCTNTCVHQHVVGLELVHIFSVDLRGMERLAACTSNVVVDLR